MPVRTRFAPSPTGYLHIGGVRTALFNWLFARGQGGRFLLRIDDTDRERNLAEALAPILRGFRWLGIDWDEGPEVGGAHGPYFQSQRQELYRAAAQRLLDTGLAYSDQGAVRLRMPREGVCRFDDRIRGAMELEWSREQDHVIQRADGSCLYHLASVVDDHEMEITHVIRAEEHLSNTPRQIFIARGLGYEPPQFAHLPYVAEPGSRNKLSKRKLSKYLKHRDFAELNRHGQAIAARIGLAVADETFNPVIVDFYEQVGFLPDAIVNYLLLLGWALDDKTELFTRAEMIEHFTLERVNKAPASFDPKRLLSFQERYMRSLPLDRKAAMAQVYLKQGGFAADPPRLLRVLEAAGERIKVAGDVLDHAAFFVPDERLVYDERAFEERLRKPADAAELLGAFRAQLAAATPFDEASLERTLREFTGSRAIDPGRIVHALRVAVSGTAVGFGLYETLAILGREACLARIDRALERMKWSNPGK